MRIKKGFTLKELLVVISIMALLIAILLPILRQAKGRAQAFVCKNNLRQIGVAADLYAQVFNSYVPRGEQGKKTWFIHFMPYLSEKPGSSNVPLSVIGKPTSCILFFGKRFSGSFFLSSA